MFGEGVETDPVAIDVNVDAALVLKDLVGIDSYPQVLMLRPNIFRVDHREQVHAVVRNQLVDAGIIVRDADGDEVAGDRVHPHVAEWLHCLDRPDMEMVVRIVDLGPDRTPLTMLRMSLVRRDDLHVLAVRLEDHLVIQQVYNDTKQLGTISAALLAALGPKPALRFTSFTATQAQLREVEGTAEDVRQAFVELGAERHAATVVARALNEPTRRAEVVLGQYSVDGRVQPRISLTVVDSEAGRMVVTPRYGIDDQLWTTYLPGDDAAVHAGIAALVELLPVRSWFDTRRTDLGGTTS